MICTTQEKIFPPIECLVAAIKDNLAETKNSLPLFHDIASQHLQRYIKHNRINLIDVFQWLCAQEIPQQPKFFGEIPITLYYCDDFVVDLYIWKDVDTDIHDHSFSGVFTVIEGEVFNINYQYSQESCMYGMKLGHLSATNIQLLLPYQQVMTIYPGKKYIHTVS